MSSLLHETPPSDLQKQKSGLSADDIYERVKDMATRFEFKPNERINEIDLSKRLHVSRTPLREVLNRLMVEGFLTRTQNKGFIGRALDPQEILDLYEFRRGLEVNILDLACLRATDAEIGALEDFTAKSTVLNTQDEDPAKLCALDEEFHMRIAALTRNAEYQRALENVNARIHYVRWLDVMKRRLDTQDEHTAIVHALKARKADAGRLLIESHISRRLDQIVDVVKAGYAEIYTRALRAS
jgi:DNA-binding GntR family transcriptional regulator